MLDALYDRADARGIELLHAYVLPPVGKVIGFTPLAGVGQPSLVAVLGAGRGPVRGLLSALQRGSVSAASAAANAPRRGWVPMPRMLSPDDGDLLESPQTGSDSWAIVADGAFDWYASSAYVRVLELPEPHSSRLLLQLPGSTREPVRIAAWRARRPGWKAAAVALGAAARIAREAGAATLRLQDPRPDPGLVRVARYLGFVPRHDLTTLWVRAHDASLVRTEAVVPTPMLYLGF
jgi:hypothetical protein